MFAIVSLNLRIEKKAPSQHETIQRSNVIKFQINMNEFHWKWESIFYHSVFGSVHYYYFVQFTNCMWSCRLCFKHKYFRVFKRNHLTMSINLWTNTTLWNISFSFPQLVSLYSSFSIWILSRSAHYLPFNDYTHCTMMNNISRKLQLIDCNWMENNYFVLFRWTGVKCILMPLSLLLCATQRLSIPNNVCLFLFGENKVCQTI